MSFQEIWRAELGYIYLTTATTTTTEILWSQRQILTSQSMQGYFKGQLILVWLALFSNIFFSHINLRIEFSATNSCIWCVLKDGYIRPSFSVSLSLCISARDYKPVPLNDPVYKQHQPFGVNLVCSHNVWLHKPFTKEVAAPQCNWWKLLARSNAEKCFRQRRSSSTVPSSRSQQTWDVVLLSSPLLYPEEVDTPQQCPPPQSSWPLNCCVGLLSSSKPSHSQPSHSEPAAVVRATRQP